MMNYVVDDHHHRYAHDKEEEKERGSREKGHLVTWPKKKTVLQLHPSHMHIFTF